MGSGLKTVLLCLCTVILLCVLAHYSLLISLVQNCVIFVGDNSGKVAIWNMAPVREESMEKDENVPKLICQMDNHLG